MLQLSGGERDVRVVAAGKFTLAYEVKGDADRRRQFVVEGIRRLMREKKFRGREVVMALASEALAVRNVRLPKMPDEELATAVNWEAQNKFPFDTATAVIQYLKAGEVHQGDQVLEEVILFAAPRVEVEAQIHLACEAGLDLVSLDAEPCAVFRGFERLLRRREDETVVTAYADIGAETTVVIARGREVVFVKTIPIGGSVFSRAVADCLDLTATEAEALRRRLGRREGAEPGAGDESDRVRRAVADAIRPHLEDLANEIALCLRYYSVTFRGPRPDAVTFTGGEAHISDIPATLAERLGIEARPGEMFRGVRADPLGPVLDRRGAISEWTTVFGLSLKGFHLAAEAAGYAA
jgi:type IV pilus assembly protein PilM